MTGLLKLFLFDFVFLWFLEKTVQTVQPDVVVQVRSIQADSSHIPTYSPEQLAQYAQNQEAWVQKQMDSMSLPQKVGQLFMISTYSNRTETTYKQVEEYIRQYHVGGIIFFQGHPVQQAKLTNRYQAASKIPLLIGMDAEWGLGMRLDETISFPKQITLGAVQDLRLLEEVGYAIGMQCQRLGIHMNFSPVADINTNPDNPVINYRAFGENAQEVADRAVAFHRGLKRARIMGSAKHFPGHGDSDADSHYSLPVLTHSENRLRTSEFIPFRRLIADSIASVMVGHLYVPALEAAPNTPATVSRRIVTDLLRNEWQFNRLVITDALNMRGLTKHYPTGQAEVAALLAGNDLLLQTANLPIAFQAVLTAVEQGRIPRSELDRKVRKILQSKYWAGLAAYRPIPEQNLLSDLQDASAKTIKEAVFSAATTVVQDQQQLLPFQRLDSTKFASVTISGPEESLFQSTLSQYAPFQHFSIPFKPVKDADWQWVLEKASQYEVVVVAVHDMNNQSARQFGVSQATVRFIQALQEKTKVVVCAFGNPYGLALFQDLPTLVCGYEDDPVGHGEVPQILFGAKPARGKLPVQVSKKLVLHQGVTWRRTFRLGFDTPLSVGMDERTLAKLDTLALEGIQRGAFPGCQVLVARQGKVVYQKSFGQHGYGISTPVQSDMLYDIASLTKVTATLQALMWLYDRGKFDLDEPVSRYLTELVGTNKESMTIREVLWHQAGLVAFIPFWKETKTGSTFRPDYYTTASTEALPVTTNLFIQSKIGADVWRWIIDSRLNNLVDSKGGHRYLYSDLGMIMMQKLVERLAQQSLDQFLQQKFWAPLGITRMTFNPLRKFSKEMLPPTAQDDLFRGELIHGTVHDPNAALLGGVAGHAGLFSNAWEIAKIAQLQLQKGRYGDAKLFGPETVETFLLSTSPKSGRPLGWNRPGAHENSAVYSMRASSQTFGHTGFTGTVVWVDPEQDLIFVFLSNRVYPSEENNKINSLRLRQRMHEVVYQSILSTTKKQ